VVDALALAADRLEAEAAALENPEPEQTLGQFTQQLDPGTVQTPALELLDETLRQVRDGEITRLIWSMPPQEGKSERVARRFAAARRGRLCRPMRRVAVIPRAPSARPPLLRFSCKTWSRMQRDARVAGQGLDTTGSSMTLACPGA